MVSITLLLQFNNLIIYIYWRCACIGLNIGLYHGWILYAYSSFFDYNFVIQDFSLVELLACCSHKNTSLKNKPDCSKQQLPYYYMSKLTGNFAPTYD